MIREFFGKIFSLKTTPHGVMLTFMGEDFISVKAAAALTDQIKILEMAMEKRIATIKILESRLEKNKELIERMNHALEAQNRQLHEQMDIINEQRRKLRHINQIDWQMNKLKFEHKKLKQYTMGH